MHALTNVMSAKHEKNIGEQPKCKKQNSVNPLAPVVTHCIMLSTNYHVNKYVRPRNTGTEIYVGRVVCCPLVNHVEYAPRALLTLENKTGQTDGQTDGRTDGRQAVTLRSPLDATSEMMVHHCSLYNEKHFLLGAYG